MRVGGIIPGGGDCSTLNAEPGTCNILLALEPSTTKKGPLIDYKFDHNLDMNTRDKYGHRVRNSSYRV